MTFLNYQGIQKYNTDVKFCGNNVSIKLYDDYQLKGYKVNQVGSFDGGFPKKREEIEHLYESYVSEQTKIKCRLKLEELEVLKKERWHRTNRRAKQRVMDLVACNANKWLDYNGNKQTTKFLTLTFKNDDVFTRDLTWCNNEVAKFMKRVCYHLYSTDDNIVRKNVLKYISVPELQKRGVWHFHIIIFNMEYVKHYKLLKWWGGKKKGSVNVKAIKLDSEGMVSRYVVKYMTDGIGHEDKKEKENEKAEYEKYIELGLEDTRRYNPSRGLHQPLKMSYMADKSEVESLVRFLSLGGYLEQLSEDPNYTVDFQHCETEERGAITYINFTIKDKKILDKVKKETMKKAYKRAEIWTDKIDHEKNKRIIKAIKKNIAIDKSIGKSLETYYKKLNSISYKQVVKYIDRYA